MTVHWDPRSDAQVGGPQYPIDGATTLPSIISVSRMDVDGLDVDVAIGVIRSSAERSKACMLINDRYGSMGYGSGHIIPTGLNRTTFTAEVDGQLVATITLAVDSIEGLAVDKTFKDEIDIYRQTGDAVVCELAKFAFKSKVHSKKLMATMFHVAFIYGQHIFGGTDLFIEINRRHRIFYEAMLGFKPIGEPRLNQSVGVPIQLMHLEVSKIRAHIDQCAGDSAAKGHSLYPFFLSPEDEQTIAHRLYADRSAIS